MMVTNAVVDKAIGRDPWKWPESFIPFIGYLVGDMAGRGPEFAPQQYISEFRTGIGNLLKYGSWKKMRKWTIMYHIIGGTQFNRIIDGIEATSKGGRVEDVRGRLGHQAWADGFSASRHPSHEVALHQTRQDFYVAFYIMAVDKNFSSKVCLSHRNHVFLATAVVVDDPKP